MSAPYGWAPGKENYRPIRTLFDCALYNINLRVTCRKCGHSVVLDAPGLWWQRERAGKDTRIAVFVKRLCCQNCKVHLGISQRGPAVEQTDAPCDGPLLPGPDEYTWKRIVNRQRS